MVDDYIRIGRQLQSLALRPGLLAPLAFGATGPVQFLGPLSSLTLAFAGGVA
jgi:hypothetical protein